MKRSEATKQQIKQTRAQTKERRKTQTCVVRQLKLSRNKLNSTTKATLNRMFLEAKWLYNAILASSDPFTFDTKTKKVLVMLPDKSIEERELKALPSQLRQAIRDRIKQSIITLSKVKGKRGRLKYTSSINSIPLNQYVKSSGNMSGTHRIYDQNYLHIQGIKQRLKIKGFNQIPSNAELANANLIRKGKDYYVHITYFIPKEEKPLPEAKLGIDFGIETDLTFSNGIKCLTKEPILPSIIKAHQKLSRTKPGSKNREKAKAKLQKAYDKQDNQKKDKCKKIVSYLTNNYQVVVQDDCIKSWTKWFGRSIQQSAIGGIMAELKHNSRTQIVDRWFSSTKLCNVCDEVNPTALNERLYLCSCGQVIDRDIHSAINIVSHIFPTEHRVKPVEEQTTTLMLKYLQTIPGIYASLSVEAGSKPLPGL